MPQNTAFHPGLHCLLKNNIFGRDMHVHLNLQIRNAPPLICIMNTLRLIVSKQMEEFISKERVNKCLNMAYSRSILIFQQTVKRVLLYISQDVCPYGHTLYPIKSFGMGSIRSLQNIYLINVNVRCITQYEWCYVNQHTMCKQ